jgi:hypothetical protein
MIRRLCHARGCSWLGAGYAAICAVLLAVDLAVGWYAWAAAMTGCLAFIGFTRFGGTS